MLMHAALTGQSESVPQLKTQRGAEAGWDGESFREETERMREGKGEGK